MIRCRHRATWLIAGGSYEWCYQCGAMRTTQETGIAQVAPSSPWCKPTGRDGENPWHAWDKRRARYREKKRKHDPWDDVITSGGLPEAQEAAAAWKPQSETADDVYRCQFCAEESLAKDWKKDRCPKCGREYDVLLAQDCEGD